jgi:hypothetical protein
MTTPLSPGFLFCLLEAEPSSYQGKFFAVHIRRRLLQTGDGKGEEKVEAYPQAETAPDAIN